MPAVTPNIPPKTDWLESSLAMSEASSAPRGSAKPEAVPRPTALRREPALGHVVDGDGDGEGQAGGDRVVARHVGRHALRNVVKHDGGGDHRGPGQ
eukprot:scaffold110436_cov66-Phaeocystis_antarctica.AAC.1